MHVVVAQHASQRIKNIDRSFPMLGCSVRCAYSTLIFFETVSILLIITHKQSTEMGQNMPH